MAAAAVIVSAPVDHDVHRLPALVHPRHVHGRGQGVAGGPRRPRRPLARGVLPAGRDLRRRGRARLADRPGPAAVRRGGPGADRAAAGSSLGDEHRDVGPGGIGILLPGPARVTADLGEGPLRFRGFGFRVELFGAIELSGLLGLPAGHPAPVAGLDDGLAEVVRYGQAHGPADAFRARAHGGAGHGIPGRARRRRRLAGRRRTPEVSVALALMDANLAGDLDVATLAAAATCRRSTSPACFKNVVGVPPMTYLQALRVSRARAALAATDRSVARRGRATASPTRPTSAGRSGRPTARRPSTFRARARSLEASPFRASRRSSTSRSQPLAG